MHQIAMFGMFRNFGWIDRLANGLLVTVRESVDMGTMSKEKECRRRRFSISCKVSPAG